MFGDPSWRSVITSYSIHYTKLYDPILLHFTVLHLLFNLLWWWYLGGMIERHSGSGKLLLLMLVAGVFVITSYSIHYTKLYD